MKFVYIAAIITGAIFMATALFMAKPQYFSPPWTSPGLSGNVPLEKQTSNQGDSQAQSQDYHVVSSSSNDINCLNGGCSTTQSQNTNCDNGVCKTTTLEKTCNDEVCKTITRHKVCGADGRCDETAEEE